AKGVNAFLANRRGALPPEFVALDYAPEPWRPADSLVWGKLMAMQLSGDWRGELFRARLAKRLGRQAVEALFPPDAGESPTIRDSAGLSAPFDTRGASNMWALAGSHTDTGAPILANDPHLGANVPSQWYLARIETPDGTLAGGTAPGVPFVVLGRNARIAWGFTSSQADVEDLFIETEVPGDPASYVTPDGSQPFETREERIRVKGEEDALVIVRATRHGPVISDALKDGDRLDGAILALSAPYLMEPDRSAAAVQGLNRARDWDDVLAAMQNFDALQQNVFYADVDGHIGYVAPGRIPIRKSGDGFLPADGASGADDWTGFIPYDELPRAYDPPAGWLANANNRPAGRDYPYYLARDWDEPYRYDRIVALLDAKPRQTIADSAAMQADILSPVAREFLPALIARADPGDDRSAPILRSLDAWDGHMAPGAREPLIFAAWLRALTQTLFEQKLGPDFAGFWDLHPRLLREALAGQGGWCAPPAAGAPTCVTEARAALGAALDELGWRYGADPAQWNWGQAHALVLSHPTLGTLPVVGKWFSERLPLGGGDDTLMRAAMRWSGQTPYRTVHIASLRAIYDLGDLDASQFLIATGQSGHPLSPHFLDLARRWLGFDYLRLGPAPADAALLRLVPPNSP
ncbi:MAG: penicillin acylase family protein, partial [Alphaproteobacteria bacterium]